MLKCDSSTCATCCQSTMPQYWGGTHCVGIPEKYQRQCHQATPNPMVGWSDRPTRHLHVQEDLLSCVQNTHRHSLPPSPARLAVHLQARAPAHAAVLECHLSAAVHALLAAVTHRRLMEVVVGVLAAVPGGLQVLPAHYPDRQVGLQRQALQTGQLPFDLRQSICTVKKITCQVTSGREGCGCSGG